MLSNKEKMLLDARAGRLTPRTVRQPSAVQPQVPTAPGKVPTWAWWVAGGMLALGGVMLLRKKG
jgi:hypothetical protein